jgi:hypothetical protein
MPSWRFYRHVVRIGIFLRERLGIGPGDRVVIGSSPRHERALAEWATVCLGAVVVPLDARTRQDALTEWFARVAPKAAFVGRAEDCRRILELQGSSAAEATIQFDPGPAAVRSWCEVLDLGGTLDTAERAGAFRGQARSLTADMPALEVGMGSADGASGVVTHGELVRRLQAFWARVPPREGDVAYVAADEDASAASLPLLAFVADGRTVTAFGSPGIEADEIRELCPRVVVAPSGLADRLREMAATQPVERSLASSLFERVPVLGALMKGRAMARDPSEHRPVREILTFDGVSTQTSKGANHDPVPRLSHQGRRSARLAGIPGSQYTNPR